MKTLNLLPGFLALLLAGALFSTGCSSLYQSSSANFASVTITNKSAGQIQAAAGSVFREHGYEAQPSGPDLVFEKQGTHADSISRNGFYATQQGAKVIERVRAELVDMGGGRLRLQCQAYMVSDAGDRFLEEEHRLANFRSGPYQAILDAVAKRLKQP